MPSGDAILAKRVAACRVRAMNAPLLSLRGVTRRFGSGRPVLDAVDLDLAEGEALALLGPSGSGKSTLLNLIAGLERPDAGTLRCADLAIEDLDENAAAHWRRHTLGFIFQAFHLIPHLDVQRNVALPLLLLGRSGAVALKAAHEALARVGLADRAAARPAELSGGEQQRVALARALIHRPRLILADEPTGNLDEENAARALALLQSEVKAYGAALVIVTHSEQAAAIATRRLRLRDGHLVAG